MGSARWASWLAGLWAGMLVCVAAIATPFQSCFASAAQPMMVAARADQGPWSFGALHAVSVSLFAPKVLLVGVLAWRSTGR